MKNPLADKYRDRMETEGFFPVATRLGSCPPGSVFSLEGDMKPTPWVVRNHDGPGVWATNLLATLGGSIQFVGNGLVHVWACEAADDGSITFHPPEVRKPEPVMVEYEDLNPGQVFRWYNSPGPATKTPSIKTQAGHLVWSVFHGAWVETLPGHGAFILMEPIPEEE